VQFIRLFVDGSSSMYKSPVANFYNLLPCEVYNWNSYEDWITPFISNLTANVRSPCQSLVKGA
jgi:hypothetical protein